MQTTDLFNMDELTHPLLKDFLTNNPNPIDALNNFAELLSKVKGQTILGEVEDGVQIHGDVYIGEGSIVHSGVVIEGPVYIGKGVIVRPHANLRRGTYLDDNCVIGHGADIKNALCLKGSKIQDGTFAGDSIIGVGARVGSGAILANRKFNQTNIKVDLGNGVINSGRDFMGAIMGDYSRLGANVILSPGTVIGAHTWVGSGVVLQGTIEGNQLVTVKQELEFRSKDKVMLADEAESNPYKKGGKICAV